MKPGNILLARDGRAMVTDFGIARLADDAEGAVPGTTLGSVHYFSPEQAKGETTTAASDVYGLGLVLYESLTGRRAWSGETHRAARGRPDRRRRAVAARRPTGGARRARRGRRPGARSRSAAAATRTERRSPPRSNGSRAVPGPVQPDASRPTPRSLAAGSGRAGGTRPRRTGAGVAPRPGRRPPPLRPQPVATSPADCGALRRASPVIAGPLVVLIVVVAIVGGRACGRIAPGARRCGRRRRREPIATPDADPDPDRPTDADRAPDTGPDADPGAGGDTRPETAGRAWADLCEPIFGFACGLGRARYEPSSSRPTIRFTSVTAGERQSTTRT